MRLNRRNLGSQKTTLKILMVAGLAFLLAPGLVLVDGCGQNQEAETEDVAEAQPEETSDMQPAPEPPEEMELKSEVSKGDVVRVHYKGTLADGSIFDQSRPDRPLVFSAGAGQMIPGFDNAVLGMKLNETKTVTIPAAEAYGPRNESLIKEVPKAELPPGFTPAVGAPAPFTDDEGRQRRGMVTEIGDDTITVDGNHPLAGKDLTFEITVVGIQ